MDEFGFAQFVTRHLNQGVQDLDPLVLGRLRAQRHALLAHVNPDDDASWSVQGGVLLSERIGRWSFGTVLLVGSLVFCGFWWQAWHQERAAEEAGFLDAKLLSAEIPPQDFAKQDFSEWLQQGR